MKNYTYIIILTFIAACANGAYFDYYGGNLRSAGEVYAEDPPSTDGPFSDIQDSTSYSFIEEYAEVLGGDLINAYGYIQNSIWDINDVDSNSVAIRFNSFADAVSYESSTYSYAFGYGSTEDDTNCGMFYRIMPSGGGQIGDDVLVLCVTTIKVSAWGSTYAEIRGPGSMSHLAITRGQMPPFTVTPSPEYEVWTLDNLALTDESLDGFTRIATFSAKIGDFIGIFARNYTDVDVTGIDDGLIESDLTIVLTVETVLRGDIDGDGDVDSADYAELANNWLVGTN